MKLKFLSTLFVFVMLVHLRAQPMTEADLGNMLEIAEERVLNHDYLNGLLWYEKCYDLNKNWEIAQNIGHMNMHLRDYEGAIVAYKNAIAWDEASENPELRFLLAKALKMNGHQDEAYSAFEFFQSMNADPVLADLSAMELAGLRLSYDAPIDPTIIITPLPDEINSRFSETSPFFVDDHTIIYSAFDPGEIDDYKNPKATFTSNIYLADLDTDATLPVRLADLEEMKNWHQSNLTFSEDGQLRAITYAHLNGLVVDKTRIFVQERSALGWTTPIEIEALGEKLLAKHVNIGTWKGKITLFFSAELHVGKGGLDIYYAHYLGGGKIANPVNIIGPINSRGDEISPFFHDDAIYFSSDGHPSMGGLDILVTHWDGLVWSPPYNLGPSINSFADDFYYVTNADQSKSLFVSNRPQGNSFRSRTCCDDIYAVSYIDDEPVPEPAPVEPEKEVVPDAGIALNEPVLLSNIYFDFNSDYLNMASQSDLDILYALMMENPSWVVEVASHTDSRGNDQVNLDLSQRRANNAMNYLVEQGISPSRLLAKGYGEQFILNHCKNGVSCTEDEHKYNRRAEFTVIGHAESSSTTEAIPVKPKYPIMKFDQSFHDFGRLKKGDKKTHVFEFVNNGEVDLIIELASACECTELDYPTDPIKPGERSKITATYDSKDKIGEQEVTIDILANTDPIIVEARFRVFVYE